jgi:hypothetical protein
MDNEREPPNDSAMTKFVRNGPEKVAKLTESKWAIDKTISIMESLALSLGNLKIHSPSDTKNHGHQETDDKSNEDEDNDERKTGKIPQRRVNFRDNEEFKDTKNLLSVAKEDIVATLVNKNADRGETGGVNENSWAYKAVKLASAKNWLNTSTTISSELLDVAKLGEKNARDEIAHNLIQLRRANFRIDKIMAGNIHTFQVF